MIGKLENRTELRWKDKSLGEMTWQKGSSDIEGHLDIFLQTCKHL